MSLKDGALDFDFNNGCDNNYDFLFVKSELESLAKGESKSVSGFLDYANAYGDDESKGKGKSRTSFAVDSLDRGSEAALQAVYANQKEDKTAKSSLAELKKITKAVQKDGPEFAVQGGV